jgi:hypothetical protein
VNFYEALKEAERGKRIRIVGEEIYYFIFAPGRGNNLFLEVWSQETRKFQSIAHVTTGGLNADWEIFK